MIGSLGARMAVGMGLATVADIIAKSEGLGSLSPNAQKMVVGGVSSGGGGSAMVIWSPWWALREAMSLMMIWR